MPVLPINDKMETHIHFSGYARPDRSARLWVVQVGRVPFYLLDTNVETNNPNDRQLTARLYTNDVDLRISQELMLGIGGVRALRALGMQPTAWHMNEGHSAFLTLERVREYMSSRKLTTRLPTVRTTSVFTTHTPVPAGNDEFPLWLVDKYFSLLLAELGMTRDEFVDTGPKYQDLGRRYLFRCRSWPALSERAMRFQSLHGQVSAGRCGNFLWPDRKGGRCTHYPCYQWGAYRHLAGPAHASVVRSLPGSGLVGTIWIIPICGMALTISRIMSSGLSAGTCRRKLVTFMMERSRQQWLIHHRPSGSDYRRRCAAGSLCPDHRFCPPVCHL